MKFGNFNMKMADYKKNICLSIGILFLFSVFFFTLTVSAQNTYEPLVNLPYTTNASGQTDFGTYVVGAFRLAIALAGLLAVIRIVWGGIKYMSSDAVSNKSEGKEVITGAVYGLLLAIGSWLIVSTINASLLGNIGEGREGIIFNFNLNPVQTPGRAAVPQSQAELFGQQLDSILDNINTLNEQESVIDAKEARGMYLYNAGAIRTLNAYLSDQVLDQNSDEYKNLVALRDALIAGQRDLLIRSSAATMVKAKSTIDTQKVYLLNELSSANRTSIATFDQTLEDLNKFKLTAEETATELAGLGLNDKAAEVINYYNAMQDIIKAEMYSKAGINR